MVEWLFVLSKYQRKEHTQTIPKVEKIMAGWHFVLSKQQSTEHTQTIPKVEKGMVGWGHEPTDGNRVIGISGSSSVNLLCIVSPFHF